MSTETRICPIEANKDRNRPDPKTIRIKDKFLAEWIFKDRDDMCDTMKGEISILSINEIGFRFSFQDGAFKGSQFSTRCSHLTLIKKL